MKRFCTQILFFILYYTRIPALLRLSQKNTVTILLYHGVTNTHGGGIFNYRQKFISGDAFEKQIQYLKKNYTILPLDEVVGALLNNTPLPPYPLAITFDDGYKNNLEFAAPILKKYNAPATIFVVTNFIDKKIPLWVDRLEYVIGYGKKYAHKTTTEKIEIDNNLRTTFKSIATKEREERLTELENENQVALTLNTTECYAPCSWEEIRSEEATCITFGAHTENHPILTQLSIEETRDEITNSITTLRSHCKHISHVFAYPNGQKTDFNKAIKDIVEEAGCIGALSTLSGTNTKNTDRYALNRYTMDGTNSMRTFVMTVSGTLDAVRKLLKG